METSTIMTVVHPFVLLSMDTLVRQPLLMFVLWFVETGLKQMKKYAMMET